jgi:hypothetical protein
MYNLFDAYIDQRQLVFTTPGGRAADHRRRPEQLHVINGGGSLNLTLNHSHKIVQTRTVSPKFEYRRGNWLINGGAPLHHLQQPIRRAAPRRAGVADDQRAHRAELAAAPLVAARCRLAGDADRRARSFRDPANFTNPRFGDDHATFAENELWQGQADAGGRRAGGCRPGSSSAPRSPRTPAATAPQRRSSRGATTAPAAARPAASPVRVSREPLAGLQRRQRPRSRACRRRFPTARRSATPSASTRAIHQPGHPANYYTAFIDSPSYVKETRLASFAMANTRFGRLQLQAGLRWEENEIASREFEARSTAEVRAAGYAVNNRHRPRHHGPRSHLPVHEPAEVGRTAPLRQPLPLRQYQVHGDGEPPGAPRLQLHHLPPFAEQPRRRLGLQRGQRRPSRSPIPPCSRSARRTSPAAWPTTSSRWAARRSRCFQNDVSNSVATEEFGAEDFGYQDDPTYSTYRFISVGNRPGTTRMRGMTLEYSQALSFLPGALRGLNVSANYTRTYASIRKAALTPHMIGGTLSYRYRRLALGTSGKWTDTTPMNTGGRPHLPEGPHDDRPERQLPDQRPLQRVRPSEKPLQHPRIPVPDRPHATRRRSCPSAPSTPSA